MTPMHWWFLRRRLRRIQLLVLDVDGVLTDGGLWFDSRVISASVLMFEMPGDSTSPTSRAGDRPAQWWSRWCY